MFDGRCGRISAKTFFIPFPATSPNRGTAPETFSRPFAATYLKGGAAMPDQDIVLAFNQIFDATRKKALAFLTARCATPQDADDLFQEIYTELFSCLTRRGADYVQNGEAFVMRLARQKLSRHYPLARRLRLLLPLVREDEDGEEYNLAEWEPDDLVLEDSALNHILLEEIRQTLAQKPPETQRVFTLFYTLDRSIPEIAKLLRLTESNVKNKLYRTLKELRARYQEALQ
jgi:RNA polymerase sigma-70 factor (ECF subfamily)